MKAGLHLVCKFVKMSITQKMKKIFQKLRVLVVKPFINTI
jgi:hypothetical protein